MVNGAPGFCLYVFRNGSVQGFRGLGAFFSM